MADAIIASAIANRPSVSVLLIGPPQAMPGTPVYFFIQSLRAGRLRNALAASSPGNDSLFGSHFSFRPSCMAMLPMCIAVLRKWSEITSRIPMYQAHAVWAAQNRWNRHPCSAEPAGRFCSAQKFGKSSGPKAQPFIQRRAKPWYIGRTACYILLCLAVFGPTGQEFGLRLTNGTFGIEDELLAR